MIELLSSGLPIAQEQAAHSGKSLLEYVQSGRMVGYLIILLSFVAVGLIVAQLVRIRVRHLAPEDARQNLDALLAKGDVKQALAYCQNEDNDSFLTRVVGAALARCARSPFGFLELKAALEETGQQETAKLYRSNDAIGLIASVAPMMGLLGTVIGMVGAFETISLTEGVTRPDQLAGNISQALVTTVMGLIVAIPATAAHTWLRNRIDTCASRIGEITESLAGYLEGGAGPQRPSPAPRGGRPAPAPAREVRRA